ncbi:beta-propeller domain-containing protein [Myxococcaceae bacterium GXIMD 01537]
MQWKTYGGLGLAALALAGCSSKSELPPSPKVQQFAKLESFDSCPALEQYIEDTAVQQLRTQFQSMRNVRDGDILVNEAPPAAPSPATGAPTNGPADHTGTNNQVAGVNEADFVQNDGTRLFVLSGQTLYTNRTWPAEQMALAGTLTIEGWPREMLLEENNRLVIFSAIYEPRPVFEGDQGEPPVLCAALDCGYYNGNTTKVTTVDVSNLAAPRVVDQLYMPGRYHTSRRVGSSVRMVMNDDFRWPSSMRWYVDWKPEYQNDKDAYAEALDDLLVKNERLIRAQTLEQWLPKGRRVGAQGEQQEVSYSCGDFYRANAPTRLGVVTVASLDLASPQSAPRRASIVAEPGEVYASAESLYIASNHWWWWNEPGQRDAVYLHKFDTRAGRVAYAGSGTVDGHIINQFAMDEHQGVLRVAATITETQEATKDQPWGGTRTFSRVTTLRQEGDRLVEAGRSPDLAGDERIQSARFVGNRGYVVTFRQVDPLFTFDLSDPAHPRKVGELKVPGFSTYMHPLDEGHLLAIGLHVPENGDWRQRALKLTLFDVTDPANPREQYTQLVGTAYGWSEAAYEHKAFNWFPAKKLLAIPFSDWMPSAYDYWGTFVSELRVFRVDTATGITPVGAVSLSDVYRAQGDSRWSWYWTPWVRRSVMADDYVYAISDAGVRVSHVGNLGSGLSTVRFHPEPAKTP